MKPRAREWTVSWSNVLGKLTLVADSKEHDRLIAGLLAPNGHVKVLAFVNAHAMNMVVERADFCAHLLQADYLLRDGSGMQMLMRAMGHEPGLNMNGTDLIPEILRGCSGKRLALWGTQSPFLEAAQKHIELETHAECVSVLDGFLPIESYRSALHAAQPDVVILGMGMPKQELVATALKECAGSSCLVVCGGAILDFLGGKVGRAPLAFRRTGLEWLYRLAREPRRLFMRYVVGNPLFLYRTIRLSFTRK